MTYRVAFVALMVALAGLAHADDNDSTIKALARATQRLNPQIAGILDQQQRRIDGKCKLASLKADEVQVMQEPTFSLDGMPERGTWQVRYIGQACKREVVRTVILKGGEKGVSIDPGVPGRTMADATLAQDVWSSFQKAAVRMKPGCSDMFVRDTTIVERPASNTSLWREAWVANVCGNDMGQVVSFYPNPTGVMFRMTVPNAPLPEGELKPGYGATGATR